MMYTVTRTETALWCEACGISIAAGSILWRIEPGPYLLCGACAVHVGAVERRAGPECVIDRIERLS